MCIYVELSIVQCSMEWRCKCNRCIVCPEGVLRGADVLARAADAAHDGQRAAATDQQPRGRPPGPRPARSARRGNH